ncbi:PQQ-dependent sugar dehydrogenase [Nocardioides dilutus]
MSSSKRVLAAAVAAALALSPAALTVGAAAEAPAQATAAAAPPPEVPTGFQDVEAMPGLSEPTAVAFAPDGTAFVALKTGIIKVFDYDEVTDEFTQTQHFANLDVNVNNYHDRGLTGIAVDPEFGTAGHNFVYVNYTYNRDPRDNPPVVPRWGPGTGQYDDCPAPAAMPSGPDPAVAGCVVDIRVSRLAAVQEPGGWIMSGAEQPLVDLPIGETACWQFGSHASGDVIIGPDGMLYASAGDGASFDTEDWGQAANPCGDPVDEGGALRAQDIRTSGDPLGLGGAIFRINPANGAVTPGAQNNASRIVAYGQRNPWRLAFRQGTQELWSADVGASAWEEVNRIDMGAFTTPVNRGWPCYEGGDANPSPSVFTGAPIRQPGWDALDIPICEDLYTEGISAVAAPYFAYPTRDAGPMTPGEHCEEGTSSISGIAFIPTSTDDTNYPAAYRGSMFFNDYARGCIWMLGKLPNGDPDPASITPFVQRAETPVSIEVGPGGDLYYVDYGIVDGQVTPGAGAVHRIRYTPDNQAPVAAVTADPISGDAPLNVSFDASGSTDADNDPLTFEWALDGDGVFDDGGGATTSRTYTAPGSVTVQVRVSDGQGGSDTAEVVVSPGNSPPQLTSVSPDASFTWAVGETVSFSATATDAQQSLPDSAFTWTVAIQHCPSVCHTHGLETFQGQRTGSFPAPAHEYPSNLLLTVTVTDDQGLTDTETVQLDPKTVAMTFASNPTGAALTVAGATVSAPHDQTFIQGSVFNVSAPESRVVSGDTYVFSSWSDGGALSHAVTAPSTPTTLTANYVVHAPVAVISTTPSTPTGPAPFDVSFSASGSSDSSGHSLTYAWDLDNDGAFDDATGVTASRTYPVGSHTVRLRATDSVGATDVAQTTVTSTNTAPVAVISPANPSGPAPLQVDFSANGSSDPNGHALTFAWDLDNDGAFDDGTGATASPTFPVGTHTVRLRATDSVGATDIAQTTVTATNQAPVAAITPANPSGPAPLLVDFDANGSSDPNGHVLTFAWDLDNDGEFDDGSEATASRTYDVGDHIVRLQVTDSIGATDIAQVTVASGNTAPVVGPVTPADGSLWSVGETIAFAATATDAQDGTLPASAYTWTLEKVECATGCSPVEIATFDDVSSGTFVAPELGLPSHLLLTVTVVDSRGTADTETVRLDPRTVKLSFTSTPPGLTVPTARTVVVGSSQTISVSDRQSDGPRLYQFSTWSDGGAATHVVTAPATDRTYHATYVPVRARVTLRTRPGELRVKVDGKRRTDGWGKAFRVGVEVKVVAPRRQWKDGVRYEFVRWSDAGRRVHSFLVPETGLRLRAVYRRVQ